MTKPEDEWVTLEALVSFIYTWPGGKARFEAGEKRVFTKERAERIIKRTNNRPGQLHDMVRIVDL